MPACHSPNFTEQHPATAGCHRIEISSLFYYELDFKLATEISQEFLQSEINIFNCGSE